MSLINTQVPPFKATAFHNGKFVEVTNDSLKGQWSVFIFMPAAFTFNCPTEVEDAADNYAEFQKLEAQVYIVTTDTHFSHKVWHETSPAVGKARFPLVGDPTHTLTNAFGVHIPLETLLMYSPLITFVQVIPATVSGLGAVQGVMIALFAAHVPAGLGDPKAVIVAYSTVSGPLMTLMRLVIGYLFVARVTRDVLPDERTIEAARAAETRIDQGDVATTPTNAADASRSRDAPDVTI